MIEFRFKLDRSPKKHLCPACNKKRLVRYLNIETGQYLPDKYGRCDRESNCGYHLNPYPDEYTTGNVKGMHFKPQTSQLPNPTYYIPDNILDSTLKDYEKNTFVQNLLQTYPHEEVEKVISLYRIGTIGKGERSGAVTFPFIDKSGDLRTIQAKQFDDTNHTKSTDFVHSIIARHYTNKGQLLPEWLQNYLKNERFVSCLFGEHLLDKYPMNPVALVEAPKTAIIGSLYYGLPVSSDKLLWIAVYNKSSLSLEKCKALKGRKIVLFPDLNAYNDWNSKANELKEKLPGTRFFVSDLLEQNATEKEKSSGLDLADYLIRFDYKLFRNQQPVSVTSSPVYSNTLPAIPKHNKPMLESYCLKPLRPTTGRLKELEDTFIHITQHSKRKPSNREQIIRLFDQYKRVYPDNSSLDELDFLILH